MFQEPVPTGFYFLEKTNWKIIKILCLSSMITEILSIIHRLLSIIRTKWDGKGRYLSTSSVTLTGSGVKSESSLYESKRSRNSSYPVVHPTFLLPVGKCKFTRRYELLNSASCSRCQCAWNTRALFENFAALCFSVASSMWLDVCWQIVFFVLVIIG